MKDSGNQIENNKSVQKQLISALLINGLRNYFKWIIPEWSDTGIVNWNIRKGAETACAFRRERKKHEVIDLMNQIRECKT